MARNQNSAPNNRHDATFSF